MSFRQRAVVSAAIAFCIFTTNHLTQSQSRFASTNPAGLRLTNAAPAPLPLPDISKLSELQKAYLDSYSILSQRNRCSEFFGGAASISALNDLISQLRPSHLDKQIGIRMSGETMNVTSAATGLSYRLFAKAEVNLDGPFYLANNLPSRQSIPRVGDFGPSTREARVAVLLHELGHLVRKPNGEYLLPNDGSDFGISRDNTDRVIAVCGEQIRQLHNTSFEAEMLIAMQLPAVDADTAVTP